MEKGKDLEKLRNRVRKRREKELIEESLRCKKLTPQETLRQGLEFSQFVLDLREKTRNERKDE